MKLKPWVRFAVPVVAALSVAVLAQPAQAANRIAWRPTILPLPPGGGSGFLTGSDGKGEYTGSFTVNGRQSVVSWRDGRPVVRGVPDGYEAALAEDENPAGVVVGTAHDYDTRISRAYTLDATGFHVKEVPAGYDYVYGVAINTRGDVLGRAMRFGGGTETDAAVLWRAEGGAPVLVPSTRETYYARDLDEDGSILFDSGDSSALWKDGVVRHLSSGPAAQSWGLAVRNGVVVGMRIYGGVEQAVRWASPTAEPVGLAGGARALSVNKVGLTAGLVPNPSGPVIVGNAIAWRATTPGEVRAPSGYSTFEASVVADDGSFAGFATNDSRDFGGVPVVWRLTP
ncbi:hypothetical protein ABT256_42695 [Amycolatopsis japonica]|uniref:hypothetical protein n=1 Tax=Amycolatopsis japonica TaxID=208439 RepID=UPI00332D4DE2